MAGDEDANLVWAWERRVAGVATPSELVGGPDPTAAEDNMPRFVLKSETARQWIPYVLRQTAARTGVNGEIHLQRARTDEKASSTNPQYRSRIVSEPKRIYEEEIPPTGLRSRRISRYARGSDGKAHFWIAREKESGHRTARAGLKFDYLTFLPRH
jgi:hypothetical protein